jgi:hypothetical protein
LSITSRENFAFLMSSNEDSLQSQQSDEALLSEKTFEARRNFLSKVAKKSSPTKSEEGEIKSVRFIIYFIPIYENLKYFVSFF